MKVAVVFYSTGENCAFVAEEIKKQFNADIIRLQTTDEKERKGAASFLWALGIMNQKPPLKPYDFDPNAYDLIVIGAPIWASSPASPVQTFISSAGITGKKIALFTCHAGKKETAMEKFKAMLPGNTIVATKGFRSPLKNSEEAKQHITDWAKAFAE